MKHMLLLVLTIASLSGAACVVGAGIYTPQNLKSYTTNSTMTINLTVYDAETGITLPNAVVNASFYSNGVLEQNGIIPYNAGFFNSTFTPQTNGPYEAIFNISNSTCANLSEQVNFLVFGTKTVSVPETNIYVIISMFILAVGYFKWKHGTKNTPLKK